MAAILDNKHFFIITNEAFKLLQHNSPFIVSQDLNSMMYSVF